jgi:serine/threonine protein kinase
MMAKVFPVDTSPAPFRPPPLGTEGMAAARQTTATRGCGYQDSLTDEDPSPLSEKLDPDLARLVEGIEIKFSRLRFGRQLGVGYYGEVFEAWLDGRRVAVKVLSGSVTPSLRKAFMRELEALRKTQDNPFIIKLIGAAIHPYHCVVMELIEGGSLHEVIYKRQVRFTTLQALKIAKDVADAVKYLHGLLPPIVHRDLTTRNVLIHVDSPSALEAGGRCLEHANFKAILSDFGISRSKEKDSNPKHKPSLGPARYRAPEADKRDSNGHFRNSKKLDVYMYGTVLYEIFYLADPFGDLPDAEVVERRRANLLPELPERTPHGLPVPLEIRRLIQVAWSFNPKLRPSFGIISKNLELILKKYSGKREDSG